MAKELNAETLKDAVRIMVRKKDGSMCFCDSLDSGKLMEVGGEDWFYAGS